MEFVYLGQNSLNKTLTNYFWPAICGLLVAAVVWFAAPQWITPQADKIEGRTLDNGLDAQQDLSGPISYSNAVRRAAPSVVNIYTSKTVTVYPEPLSNAPFFQSYFNSLGRLRPSTQEQKSLGTGVIVSQEGYVITNEHVIADADEILVAVNDGRTGTAEVVGTDSITDLAVLKIQYDDLTPISTGDPEAAQVGDVVLAIGNAQGLQQTVTQGILSAKGRNLADMDTYVNVNFLQTDAAINQGNSGGPLVDVYGNMIGINSRTLQSDGSFGLSFAIPADIVSKVFRDIVEHGTVIRGWLGVEAGALRLPAEEASAFGFEGAFVVTNLYSGGPAHRAGLERGDLIFKINGSDIGNGRYASRVIADTVPGENIEFEILRGNEKLAVTVQAALRPDTSTN